MQPFDIPLDDGGTLPALTFSPDGRLLLVNTRKRCLIRDTVEGQWLTPVPGLNAQFVLGGQALAYLGFGAGLSVMELPGGEHRSRVPQTRGQAIVAAPDGQTVYLLSRPDDEKMVEVETYDVATFGCRNTFARHKAGPDQMVGSANGRKLAIGEPYAEGEPVRAWDIENSDAPPVEVTPKGKFRHFALSSDGSRLGIVTTKGVSLWDTATGSEIFTSGKHRCAVGAVCFHPSRPLMATGDSSWNVFLWDFTGRVLTRLKWDIGEVHALAFSPDGLRCAAAGTYHVVIWDLDL